MPCIGKLSYCWILRRILSFVKLRIGKFSSSWNLILKNSIIIEIPFFLKNSVVSEIFSMLNFSFRKFFRDKLSSWEIFSSLKFSFWIFSLLNFRFYRIFFFLFFYMKFRLKNIASLKFYLDRIILLLEFSSKL